MSLRILIDLQGAQNGSRHRGIGRYSLALAKGIARNAGVHRVFILLNEHFLGTIAEIKAAFSDVLSEDRFLVFGCPGPVAELEPQNVWRRRTAEILREHVIETVSPDVVLITSMIEGSVDNTVTSIASLPSGVATAAILYDLIPLTDPERYIGWEPAKRWYHGKIDSLRRADLLLSISEATRIEAIRMLDVEPQRIRNISSAADSSFSSSHVSAVHSASVAKRFGIVRKYLMHSSAFEARKNFQGLIRAFAALPLHVRSSYQLVLVCKLDSAGREELVNLAAKAGLSVKDLVLTGFITDEDLVALYAACHLFVFPSFQEGFGLPALEAMCCGTPAIGSNVTSVPEVIGRADALFDPTSDESMTALILKVLTDSSFYDSLKRHAKKQAARFSWDDSALAALAGMEELVARRDSRRIRSTNTTVKRRRLMEAVAQVACEIPPSDAEILELARSLEANENAVRRLRAAAAFAGSMTWRIEGPFDSTYSLALLNRETARALSALGHTVVLHSTEGPGDFVANDQFLALNPDLQEMHERVADHPHDVVDAVSRNLYPPRVADMHGPLNLLHHYAWEESGFPPAWVENFNMHLDGLTCLSTHVEKVLVDNGVHVPLATSGCGVDHWERIVPTADYPLSARSFRFLHVSSCFPRKGIDTLLEAYGKAFQDSDDVSLIIKTFRNPHNEIHSLVSNCQSRAANYPHVLIIEGDLSDSDLKSLYQHCHALVAPSRAEGFGLPLAEAMLSGLPVITTGWSGQLDFCNDETAWLVDYLFKRAQTHFELSESVWAEADVGDLARALSTAYRSSPTERRSKANAGRELLLKEFKWSDVAARLIGSATAWRPGTGQCLAQHPRIGWITTWNTRCGIASYSEQLIAKLPQTVTVFAPHNQVRIIQDGSNCVRSWRSGKEENYLSELAAYIGDLGIDTLVLQFNYGLFNLRQLSQFLLEQIDSDRTVIVIMHSTGDPGLLPDWNWTLATIAPALGRCHRVLVHSIDDLNRLKLLGLISNVSLFPHGVIEVPRDVPAPAARPLPLIATYGFCLPHKGLAEIVKAVGLMRAKGKLSRLRLVNAEYPAPVSAELVAQIRQLVMDLDLQDLVEMNHDYLADHESLHLLKDADLIVYPYQETNESASGAVRIGLAASRPVAVTPIPIFGDLDNAVHRLPGTQPADLASGIAALLDALARKTEDTNIVAKAAERWRATHGYSALGARLHGMCIALGRDRERFTRVFDGSSRQLRTEVGRPEGRSLLSTGRDGYVLFGPYMALGAGNYRVMVRGGFDIPGGSNAHCDVCIHGASEILARVDLVGRAESLIMDIEISLTSLCRDLEVRLAVTSLCHVRVNQIEVSQILIPDVARSTPVPNAFSMASAIN